MDRERLLRLLTGAMVPVAGLGVVLSLATDDPVFAGVFAVGAVAGAFGYWTLRRYPAVFDVDTASDLATERTFVASLFKLAVFGFEFAFLGYLWVAFELASATTIASPPSTVALGLLGASAGVFLGAGVPLLAQRRVVFHRLEGSYAGQIAGSGLTLGAYVGLLVAAPGAVATFVAAYVASRFSLLVGGLVLARR